MHVANINLCEKRPKFPGRWRNTDLKSKRAIVLYPLGFSIVNREMAPTAGGEGKKGHPRGWGEVLNRCHF